MNTPADGVIRRIAFVGRTEAGQPALMTFAHPAPTLAVIVESAPAFEILTLDTTPKDQPTARAEMHAWVAESDPAGAITTILHGAQVVWRPGRASILAAPERLEPLLLALVEFGFYEGELRKLEAEIAAAWPDLDADTPLAYDVTADDLERHADIGKRMDATLKRRIRFARMEAPMYQTRPGLGSMAQELGDRLREKARIESRIETLDGHLEVFEYIYEMASQRIAETKAARKERSLEWLIIVLLAAETLMLLIDLLWTLEV